jgi:hypothetical protein
MSSRPEGLPLAMVEAMLCGRFWDKRSEHKVIGKAAAIPRYYEEIRLLHGQLVSLPPSGHAAPDLNTATISAGFWVPRSLARSPDRPGLHRTSRALGAYGLFPTRPRGVKPSIDTQHACSCLRLTIATNRLRRGLSPPIKRPCLAHQGCSPRSHRLRRPPITPPAVYALLMHCCTWT